MSNEGAGNGFLARPSAGDSIELTDLWVYSIWNREEHELNYGLPVYFSRFATLNVTGCIGMRDLFKYATITS